MIYKMDLKDSSDTMTFNLLETPIVDKDIEGAVDNVTLDGNQYTDYLYLKKQYIQKWAIMCPDEYDELRGFYTRQFEEGEVPSYRVYYGANVTRDYTFNGDYFKFNAEGIETGMTLSQLLGNAEQTTYSGKNLANYLDAVKATNDTTLTFVDNGFRQVTTSSGYGSKLQITGLTPSTTYTISWSLAVSSGTASKVVRVFEGTGQSVIYAVCNPVPTGATHLIFTTGASATSVNIWFYNGIPGAGDTTWTKIMLEKGSSASSYEPYVGGIPAPNPAYPQDINVVTGTQTIDINGTSYPINLGNIWLAKIGNYQDRIYKNEGKWYIEKQTGKAILNGSETWFLGQTLTNTVHFNIGDYTTVLTGAVVPSDETQVGLCLSNYFEEKANLYAVDQVGIDLHSNKNLIIGVPNSIATTLADFKTWLASHPTTFYYALATPTTTEITDETLLLQLNFLASLYEGENNISLVGTGAQGEMEVFIRDVMSVETDVVPEVPVRLTLTDDGVINACGCRRNVQLTMRETTE